LTVIRLVHGHLDDVCAGYARAHIRRVRATSRDKPGESGAGTAFPRLRNRNPIAESTSHTCYRDGTKVALILRAAMAAM